MDENLTTFWYDDHTVFGMIISGMKFILLFFFFAVSGCGCYCVDV